jgi:type IV pilus assembly protein PilY1
MTHLLINRFKPKTSGRTVMRSGIVDLVLRRLGRFAIATLAGLGMAGALAQTVDLADRPLFSTNNVPGNLMLGLSVEWPTASTPAYLSTAAYSASATYLGYFVPTKCYQYTYVSATPETSYFSAATAASSGACTSTTSAHRWSGNYLNWAAMQSLDIFRWTLTGGDRAVDTTTQTILEKTRHSGQGGDGIYPNKNLTAGVSGASPFTSASLESQVQGLGTFMKFSPVASVTCNFNVNGNRRALFTCTPTGGAAQSCNTANSRPSAGGSSSCNIGPVAGMTIACTATRSAAGVNSGNTYGFSCVGNSAAVATAAQTCAATSVNYSSGAADATCASGYAEADYTGTGTLLAGTRYRAQIRVKACDAAGGGVESSCKAYGSNYKPEGLMQEYAMQLRFGAFGYLNDDSITRDGGVVRAQIRSIGPQTPVPGSAAITNSNTEWSATTGVFNANPDAAAATQTSTDAAAYYPVTVNNSGVINYLNKFGKLTTSDYKQFDPVGEMYYAATRYFRNQGNVPSYTSLAGAGSQANLAKWIDGFPVIRQWSDPVQYSCQKNFILGMGDVYAWMDKNLPGSTITNVQNAGNWAARTSEPTMPSEVSGDTAVNVTTATNMVGQLEGLSNLGTTLAQDGGASERANSTFIAGLAYEAHTRDIRPETAMPGMQTISTYWLDVRESQTYESKNQYWLAAKYGGFEIPSGFDPYATGNNTGTIPNSAWTQLGQTIGSDSRPNNYFVASDPAAMVAGLRAAFARISSENEAASTTAFSTTTAKVSRTGTASYATQYNPRNWTGDVEASEITFNQYGVPELATRWNAGALLDATAAGSRKIVTCCTSAGAALPFRATNLAGTLGSRTNYGSFANVPGVTGTQTAADYVDYLRGVRTLETSYSGGKYRTRTSVLGDIVGSRANPVGKPQFPYADLFNPGYSAFKTLHADRKTVVYVGANDGMLHAFDGTLPVSGTCASGTCGNELFAFIPSFSYGSTNTIAAAQGLASLGNPNFSHRYLVDATAQNYDVDFFNTPGPTATAADWRTMLIGGLGKGGRGYYALDITKPDDWTTETAMAGKFLWEFTDSRMGNTFGEAIVVKTKKYGWTVVVPSGYNNSDGVGYIFLLNPRTGALLDTISTPEGSTAAPINMAHANAFVPSFREYVADAIYAGDMRGNLWRFDLTATSGTYPQATKLATLTDGASVPKAQAVTTRPLIEIDPTTNRRYVVVATGRLLADSDISSTDQQTLYVIADGKSGLGEFYPNTPLPTSITFPIGRNNLNNNSNPLNGIGSAPAQPMGWYLDLVVPTTGPSERVNADMTANLGAVLAAVNLPNGQACQGGGTGRLLGLRLSDGRTVLVQENTTTNTSDLVASQAVSNVITNLSFLTVGGQTRAYYGTTGTSSSPVQPLAADTKCGGAGGNIDCTNLDTGGAVVRRLNWREVQTAN